MFEFFARLFRSEPSGAKAKERLRLVLLSDHLALAPDVVESLKTDLLEVISRYVEVDTEHVDVTFEQREHEVAMLANVPILSVRDDRPQPTRNGSPTPIAAVESDSPMPVAVADAAPPKPARARRRRRRKSATAKAAAVNPQQPAPQLDGVVAPPP